jgi:hypothetical protein
LKKGDDVLAVEWHPARLRDEGEGTAKFFHDDETESLSLMDRAKATWWAHRFFGDAHREFQLSGGSYRWERTFPDNGQTASSSS